MRLALDVLCIGLLDPPPALRPGLLRSAWDALLSADPFVSLGNDAARLEALAGQDHGELIRTETLDDALLEASLAYGEHVLDVMSIPDDTGTLHTLVAHPAAMSLPRLTYAARHGLTLDGATPGLQAAIVRFLEAVQTEVTDQHPDLDNQVFTERAQAITGVAGILRLLYLPQLLPNTVDVTVSLHFCALLWRLAHDTWRGPAEWQADMDLLRVHLKGLGRVHDVHRDMRVLERYGTAPTHLDLITILEEAMEQHHAMLRFAQESVPDIDPLLLDLPDTPAARLAQRVSHLALNIRVPRSVWGPHMHALTARVRNVPPSDRLHQLVNEVTEEVFEAIVTLTDAGARAALLLALNANPDREVLTACAVGLAQLKEAARHGAPIGSMTLEFEQALRALWRSLGRPPCSWLSASRGPTGTEVEAWKEQREALIHAALHDHRAPAAPTAPETYGYVPWEGHADTQDHPDDPQTDPGTPFTCGLTPTERAVLKSLQMPHAGAARRHLQAARQGRPDPRPETQGRRLDREYRVRPRPARRQPTPRSKYRRGDLRPAVGRACARQYPRYRLVPGHSCRESSRWV